MSKILIIPLLLFTMSLAGQQNLVELKGETGKVIRRVVKEFQSEYEEFDDLDIAPSIYIIENHKTLKFMISFETSISVFEQFAPIFYFTNEAGLPIYIYSQIQTVFSLSNEHKDAMVNAGKGFIEDGFGINIRYYPWYVEIKKGKLKKLKKKVPNWVYHNYDSFEAHFFDYKN